MLRLKKAQEKKEETPAPVAVAATTDEGGDAMQVVDSNSNEAVDASTDSNQAGGVSITGIGGKQVGSGGPKRGKKRTPGEIRIQKGKDQTSSD